MSALNIEDDIERCATIRSILATDADVDGMHIRNLLITFFLTYFEGLVLNGHLHILETPLFKVRDKEQNRLLLHRRRARRGHRKDEERVEVTRFKGLGEISPQ